MKNYKLLSLVIALMMALSLFTFSAFAEEATGETTTDPSASETTDPTDPTEPTEPVDPNAPVVSGDWTYKNLTETTIELIAYKGTDAKCVIPEKLDNKTVTSLASALVRNNAELVMVEIPGTVTTIAPDSFMGCINLKQITVKSGALQSFDVEFCQSLETVILPETVKTVGKFEHCSMLQKIDIAAKNANLKSVDGVVYSADGKTLIKYPAGKLSSRFAIASTVTAIADYAFSETGGNVKEIYVPASVVKMGDNAFYDSVAKILFQAAKIPAGCENAVKGKQTALNQINVYAPKKVESAQNATQILLKWEKVTGADGYAVYYKNSKGWVHYKNIVANEILISKLVTGAKYTFAVKSLVRTAAGVVASPDYITYQAATAPAATKKIASAKNDTEIKIAWEKVAGADGYAIYYMSGKTWKHAGNTTGNSATFKKLKPYTDYTFAVRTLLRASDKIVAGSYRTITVKTNLGVPVVTAKQINATSIRFTWTPAIGASHYQVYYKVNNSKTWTLLGTYNKVVSATVPGLVKGINISLAVRAVRVESNKIVAKSDYKPVTVTMK
ncbi:MAG: hypothetical protein E7544_06850 [Ruminococcaceae bacterium]|nr:hypothetical protein [Oscillospiraceae bacterium]